MADVEELGLGNKAVEAEVDLAFDKHVELEVVDTAVVEGSVAAVEALAIPHNFVQAHIPAAAEAAEAAEADKQLVGTHRALEGYNVVPVGRAGRGAIVSRAQRTPGDSEGVGKAAKVRRQVVGVGTTDEDYVA